MHQTVNNEPSDLFPREAQKRDQVVMVLIYATELEAIEGACIEANASRSSLIYAILQEATENFTNFSVPEGAKLRRRSRTQDDGGVS